MSDTQVIAWFVGRYLGAAFITGAPRLVVKGFQRRQVDRALAGLVAFLVVAILAVALLTLTMGFSSFVIIYLPCLIFWLAYDFYKARTARSSVTEPERPLEEE